MSVELPIRIPIQSMPSLSNVEGIQTVLEDMLSDHEHSDSAMAVHDLTQATLTSAKALPCIIVHKDEPENVKRFSADPPSPSASGWGAYSKKTSIAASPPPSASAWGDHLLAPNSPRLSRSSAQGWVGVPKSGPGDNWSETSFAIGHIKIIVRDAMMRCHTFQLARDSTLTILTKLYGQRIGMDLEVTRCLWAKLNSQQQFNSQQYGLSLQTLRVHSTMTLTVCPVSDITIKVQDWTGKEHMCLFPDNDPFEKFESLLLAHSGVSGDKMQYAFTNGIVIDRGSSAGKTLKQIGMYDGARIFATLKPKLRGRLLNVLIEDGTPAGWTIHLSTTSTLGNLIKSYCHGTDRTESKISLTFKGKKLEDPAMLLTELGLYSGATVDIHARTIPDPQKISITFRDTMGREETHGFNLSDTNSTLIDRYASSTGLTSCNVQAKFGCYDLNFFSPNTSLEEMSLKDGDTVHVSSKQHRSQSPAAVSSPWATKGWGAGGVVQDAQSSTASSHGAGYDGWD